jgi:murein DD-endopeptidase MepM/ murein hydrolase activator NlpD
LCRPVPENAWVSFPFGITYKWGTHYGTDFVITQNGIFKNVPSFALTSGTVSTGWHETVDGIVFLRPDGFDNVVIKYYHMNENSISGIGGRVECGDSIGFADGGGTVSDGSHLHLQIEVDGICVDAEKWMDEH